jgi:ATP-dependent DNA ligase
MTLRVPLSLKPMEAEPVNELPSGPEWQYEPKIDGFRCLIFREREAVHLQSRRQRPLQRYFPEVADAALILPLQCFVLDGELVIPGQPFDTLQLRLHPAISRVQKLAQEHPARFVAFDMLADETDASIFNRPFVERREALEAFFDRIGHNATFILSNATRSRVTARTWLKGLAHGLDGVVAKRLDLTYQPGRRAMQKFKLWKTVDCVVGGLYCRPGTRDVEYLLLGLYDDAGRLSYVGRCGVHGQGGQIGRLVQPLVGGTGFTGNAPGGKSRWSNRERAAVLLRPKLVAEVSADHIENGRFRHGSRLVRFRDDKPPEKCTMDQVESAKP